jgi:hypothetical protein
MISGQLFAQSEQTPTVYLRINDTGDKCEWTGGTDGNGNVVIEGRKQGKKKIVVEIQNNGYKMELKGFRGEGSDQMEEDELDKGKRKKIIKIKNKNIALADVDYDIWAYDGKNKIIACDPKIINK